MIEAEAALGEYALAGTKLRRLDGGLINLTFLVENADGRWVLQRLHPIFGAEVHEDIEAVTAHLARKGMTTPRLLRTRDERLCTVRPDGVWRILTFIEGETIHRVDSAARAASAGRLVGRFHAALADLRHDFRFRRAGVHDTARHFALLDDAVETARQHPQRAAIAELRDELRAGLASLPSITAAPLPRRIAHGDLKISNLLFDAQGRGACLLDLDTLGEMPLPYELGDAFRSWCNPLGEDEEGARFERPLYDAAWAAYENEMGAALSDDERRLIVPGLLTICLELSARFARDVLEDRYFGWDPARFPSRAAHNLRRARSQAALYRSARAQLG